MIEEPIQIATVQAHIKKDEHKAKYISVTRHLVQDLNGCTRWVATFIVEKEKRSEEVYVDNATGDVITS
jgi:hypothetical protein